MQARAEVAPPQITLKNDSALGSIKNNNDQHKDIEAPKHNDDTKLFEMQSELERKD